MSFENHVHGILRRALGVMHLVRLFSRPAIYFKRYNDPVVRFSTPQHFQESAGPLEQ